VSLPVTARRTFSVRCFARVRRLLVFTQAAWTHIAVRLEQDWHGRGLAALDANGENAPPGGVQKIVTLQESRDVVTLSECLA
jgi:hypothetical protein